MANRRLIELRAEVPTGSGEIAILEFSSWRNKGRYDWWSKLVTSDCPACPAFVRPEGLEKILPALRRFRYREELIPHDPRGVCLIGRYKFLVQNPDKPARRCEKGIRRMGLTTAGRLRSDKLLVPAGQGSQTQENFLAQLRGLDEIPEERSARQTISSPQMRLEGF
jgi:hypothetical protein